MIDKILVLKLGNKEYLPIRSSGKLNPLYPVPIKGSQVRKITTFSYFSVITEIFFNKKNMTDLLKYRITKVNIFRYKFIYPIKLDLF